MQVLLGCAPEGAPHSNHAADSQFGSEIARCLSRILALALSFSEPAVPPWVKYNFPSSHCICPGNIVFLEAEAVTRNMGFLGDGDLKILGKRDGDN